MLLWFATGSVVPTFADAPIPHAVKLGKMSEKNTRRILYSEGFENGQPKNWTAFGDAVEIAALNGSPALKTGKNSQVFWGSASDAAKKYADITIEGDVAVGADDANAGFLIRADRQQVGPNLNGYFANIRKLRGEAYSVVQLYRLPEFVLLQEARVRGTPAIGVPVHLKVTCRGKSIWIWAGDANDKTPALTEYDDRHLNAGFIGLKSENNQAMFDNVVVSTGGGTPRAPLVRDWSNVKGAVFVTSNSVNSYQMWEEYQPATIDRELGYAARAGLNMVEVYLNFLMWQKDEKLYLRRIDDFLQKAAKHKLKVTFVLFDDVGNVEPPHLAPYGEPVPGVHNSQMQGSPGRDIVDKHYAASREKLKAYVTSVVSAHKSDARIAFWQTYNEPSHETTLPLLADSYHWIKETGSKIPVSATGGATFFGSYYSDFPTFHSYLSPDAPPEQPMTQGDGGSEHLCTETLDRPGVDVPKLVNYFAARKTGWIVWELMIGRDNCRFPWGSPPGAPEPTVPFHGLLYPDGRPFSPNDIAIIRAAPAAKP